MNRNEIRLSPHVTFLPDSSCLINGAKEEIHLTPNERRLLELIIAGKGRKELIIDEVWRSRGTIVGESSYHQLIKMLRKKLQLAGLPGTVIKTIPRYGVRLIPFEPDITLVTGTDQDTAAEDDELHQTQINACAESESNAMMLVPSTDTEKSLTSPGIRHDKKRVCLLISLLACFILVIYWGLVWLKPNPFPYKFGINHVVFHLSSLGHEDRQAYLQHKDKLSKEIRHVYIASNGPKVWIAKCDSEIAKEAKCHYENYSVY